jgi:hypothetical protein
VTAETTSMVDGQRACVAVLRPLPQDGAMGQFEGQR